LNFQRLFSIVEPQSLDECKSKGPNSTQKLTVEGRSVVSLGFKCQGYFTVPLTPLSFKLILSLEKEREREGEGEGNPPFSTQSCFSYFDTLISFSRPKEYPKWRQEQ